MANIQPTIAYLEKIEFDELSKENFPEFKAKVRSSMVASSNVDIVQLTKGMGPLVINLPIGGKIRLRKKLDQNHELSQKRPKAFGG